MVTITRRALGLVAVALLAACTSGPGAAPPESLAGREFLSTRVTERGAERPLVSGTRIRLTFEAARLSASAGCNTMGGSYTLTAGQLLVTDLSTTEMGCDPDRHAQDEWLAEFLTSKPTLRLDGNNLTLEADGTVVLLLDREIAEPDLPLVGTAWTLDTITSGDVVSSIPAGVVPPSLAFGTDGRVTLTTGCNDGFATYTVEGSTIRFSAIGTTKKACPGAGDEVERAVLAVLGSGAVGFDVDGARLRITAGDHGLGYAGAPAT